MTVAQIPADTLVVMTPELYQEFCQGGCVPACHLTTEWINIGDFFHLCTVIRAPYAILCERAEHPEQWDTHDVMLAGNVSIEQYNSATVETLKATQEKMREESRGCFRVNGKIVTGR